MIKDINDFYFTKEDYETFNNENSTKNTSDVRDSRKRVKEKLLDINQDLYPLLLNNNLNLATHKKPEHLTSLDYPCGFNNYRVDWLGIRYGRNASDIEELTEILKTYTSSYERQNARGEDPKIGFQKYACLQVNVCSSGIEIGIFHSVPFQAIDRLHMHSMLSNDYELQDKIVEEIRKLQGYGYVWGINDTQNPSYEFKVDEERPEDFISFYRNHDKDGCWSSMLKHFPMYDDKIYSKENIVETSYNIIEQLKPLYELVIWKRGNRNG